MGHHVLPKYWSVCPCSLPSPQHLLDLSQRPCGGLCSGSCLPLSLHTLSHFMILGLGHTGLCLAGFPFFPYVQFVPLS